ncbi:branched-chain amino acid transporter permease [Acetobacterium woodii]|uniref:branched-chain amino acid transporter permease n=1 Tax=Acetobacterium woodii TaxID=33952 RepID=UPI0005A1F4D8|nr:AzlD domain-containing protein [Acetobacterium woodii]
MIVTLVTVFTRALPFIFLGGKKELPDTISYLGKVFPAAIMIILSVFSLRNINLISFPYGLAELISVAAVMIIHLKKKNVFLSIFVGTSLYMVLIRTVFLVVP